MLVYIGVCGIGIGHAGRCIAIAEKLKKEGIDVVFSTYGPAYNFIKEKFSTFYSDDIVWEEKRDGTPDPYATLFKSPLLVKKFLGHVKRENSLIKKLKPDLILSDSRYSTILVGGKRKIPTFFLTNQTKAVLPDVHLKKETEYLFTWIWTRVLKYSKKILIPDLPPPYTVCNLCLQNWGKITKKYKFVGFCIEKKSKELPDKKKLMKGIGVREPFVFISVSGPGISKKPLIDFFSKEFRNTEDFYVLLNEAEVGSTLEERNEKFIRMGWLDDFYKYLKACDLVISRSGLGTVSAILAYGKRSILIPTKGQPEQEGNSKGAQRLGVTKVIEQDNLRKINNTIKDCLNDKNIGEKLEEIKKVSKKYDGLENVLKEILS
jgi:UDP-N-acetylglucosamine--N-acetylmuramyl-(pentapeptide) pyrophosphoryl-undecaprenol N-acetylglucosamine transferase